MTLWFQIAAIIMRKVKTTASADSNRPIQIYLPYGGTHTPQSSNRPIVLHVATAKCWTPDWFLGLIGFVLELWLAQWWRKKSLNIGISIASKRSATRSLQKKNWAYSMLGANNNRNSIWMHSCAQHENRWIQLNELHRIQNVFYVIPRAIMSSIIHNKIILFLFLFSIVSRESTSLLLLLLLWSVAWSVWVFVDFRAI